MVTMEGCHWERKVILLLISVFHRDQPGSQMVRAGVMQLLCAALGDQPGSQMVRARVTQPMKHWEEGQVWRHGKTDPGQGGSLPQWKTADAQWGKNKPRISSRDIKDIPTDSEILGRILRRLYSDKKDDETEEFMTSFTLTS